MRKIISTTFITLDGVMQSPGGSKEDTTEGFQYGGWQFAWDQDPKDLDHILDEFMSTPFEMLLGRRTYDIFAGYWPHDKNDPRIAQPFNSTKKYVVSHKPAKLAWNNSTLITGDVVAEIQKLKDSDNPDLWVWGSGNLLQTLLKNHLIDRIHLWIYPITLGTGKKLFAEGTQPMNFKLVDSKISTTGVIFATYEPTTPIRSSSLN